jgi:RNA polymerase-binding transcription factor DksA
VRPEDRAQELELQEWEARQESAGLPEPDAIPATHCRDIHCGEEIPEERRKAYPRVRFCAACQARREKAKGSYAGTN